MTIAGGCLCGKVRYECAAESGGGHCHCNDCRKTSGTGHCSHMIVAEDQFSMTGELSFFDKPADSGNMVSRGFCPECGRPSCRAIPEYPVSSSSARPALIISSTSSR